MALLEIRDLVTQFDTTAGTVQAVDGISYTVEEGETVAVVGESGCGKSVSALSILRLIPDPPGRIAGGGIRFMGRDLLALAEDEIREIRGRDIGMVFQEPMTSLNPVLSVGVQLTETVLRHRNVGTAAAEARALELLRMVGISEPERRLRQYPHHLSGGMRQRVMIALALSCEPKLIIADEPTTALDVTIQAQILELLRELRDRLGMALLLITHDLGIVRKMADRVYVMNGGRIVESGKTRRVFDAPEHPYTRHLLAATPGGEAGPAPPEAGRAMRVEALKVWFPLRRGLLRRAVGHVRAVDGISLEVREGETVGVVGESGSGKTTLGLAMLKLQASEGRIAFLGRPIDALRPRALRPLRREMQIVFQDPYGSLSPRMSVGRIVEEGLRVHGLGGGAAEREALIVEALAEVGLDPDTRHRYPHEFSGGQRQRVAIARAIVLRPRFVVLDEPTSALDVSVQAQIVSLLRSLQARHRLAYLFISHDLRVVRAMSHEVLVMREGSVVERGPAARIFREPREPYTRALVAAAFDLEPAGADGGGE